MLTIRDAQMHTLEEALWLRLIFEHIQECFPVQCEKLGTETSCDLVQRALNKAREYNFNQFVDIQQYVDLVIVLGEDFESEPEFAWTREILEDANPAGAKFRATWLYDRVIRHLAEKERRARQ